MRSLYFEIIGIRISLYEKNVEILSVTIVATKYILQIKLPADMYVLFFNM